MKLLTKEIEKRIPSHYSQEKIPEKEKVVYAKFFTPFSNWTWYVTEYDSEEGIFFGLVFGHEREWCYFSLAELQELADRKPGLVERDKYFDQCQVKDLPEEENKE